MGTRPGAGNGGWPPQDTAPTTMAGAPGARRDPRRGWRGRGAASAELGQLSSPPRSVPSGGGWDATGRDDGGWL